MRTTLIEPASDVVGSVAGRRERNRRKTRAAIIAATLALVDTRGFERVTIEMIAELAEVSPRTFSNYFAGKDEAFFASEPEPVEDIRAAFALQPTPSPLGAVLRGVLGEIAANIAGAAASMDVRMTALQAHPRLIPAFRARFGLIEAVFGEEIGARLDLDPDDHRDCRPQLLAGLIASLIRGSLEQWRAGDRLDDLPEILTTSFDTLVATVADLG